VFIFAVLNDTYYPIEDSDNTVAAVCGQFFMWLVFLSLSSVLSTGYSPPHALTVWNAYVLKFNEGRNAKQIFWYQEYLR